MEPAKPRREFSVGREETGRILSEFILQRCPEAPAGFLNRLLRKGFIHVNGAPALPGTLLSAGQRVAVTLPPGAFLVAPNREVPFTILHEDEHVAVVAKPAGVITEPGIGHKLDTLLNGLMARYGEALDRLGPEHDFGLAHRLDKETSGLLVVARTAAAHSDLVAQFRRRAVEKQYVALVSGRMERDHGAVHAPLGRERHGGRAVGLLDGGATQPATTTWRVIERFADATLIAASPKTGRWRQIRLHFQAIGHPVAGDPDHGDPEANRRLSAQCGLERMFLHAERLSFIHPATGRRMSFELPLPKELRAALGRLRAPNRAPAPTAPPPRATPRGRTGRVRPERRAATAPRRGRGRRRREEGHR